MARSFVSCGIIGSAEQRTVPGNWLPHSDNPTYHELEVSRSSTQGRFEPAPSFYGTLPAPLGNSDIDLHVAVGTRAVCGYFIACATAFHWLSGGKFFRFYRGPAQAIPTDRVAGPVENVHHVEHFWLCERSSHIYTLGYEPGRGVLLRLQWPELPGAETNLQLPVAGLFRVVRDSIFLL